MARINNLNNFLTDVADAIKSKKGSQELIPAANFDTEIVDISTGKLTNEEYSEAQDDLDDILENTVLPTDTINITENGTVDVSNYATANVNVSGGSASYDTFSIGTDHEESYDEETWEQLGAFDIYWLNVNDAEISSRVYVDILNDTETIINNTESQDVQFWSRAPYSESGWQLTEIVMFNNTSHTYKVYLTDENGNHRIDTNLAIGPHSGFATPYMVYYVNSMSISREHTIQVHFETVI